VKHANIDGARIQKGLRLIKGGRIWNETPGPKTAPPHIPIRALALLLACFAIALPAVAVTFTVNSTADAVDANPGDGVCETVPGNGICTLRAAIQEAGASSVANVIMVPPGTYRLTLTPVCSYKMVTNPNLLQENMSALCVKGTVTITGAGSDSTIIDAGGAGGATCCGSYPSARGMVIPVGANVTLTAVTIQHGLSNGGFTLFGGGGINNQGKLSISDCVFTSNSGLPGGGGIWNDGSLIADGVTFSQGFATAYGGAALYNNVYGTAEVSNSTFQLNQSNDNGGAVANPGVLKILSSTFANNSTLSSGGAIYNPGTMVLTNVTLASNQGVVGGAIRSSGSMTVNNSTIALNHASNHTGGVSTDATFIVSNSIISGNVNDPSNAPTDCEGPITSQGHNLISSVTGTCQVSGATSTDLYGVAAGLAALADNGGRSQTLALTSSSKAIDAGDPSAPGTGGTSCAAADQRGLLRSQGGRCDIGAFERNPVLSVSAITPLHAANISAMEGVIFGNGMQTGASVSLRKSGQADILGTQAVVQEGNATLAVKFDLTGKAAGVWDILVTNPDGSNATLPAAFTVDASGLADVWAESGGPPLVRPGSTPTFYVLFGNRGNVDALDVPITIAVPAALSLALRFYVQTPPAQAGQVSTDWTLVPRYVTPGTSTGIVNVPLILPIIPAGYSGSLRFTVTIPSDYVHGETMQVYVAPAEPLLQVGVDPSVVVSQMAAAAASYAQQNLGVTIPSSQIQLVNQYISNQLQSMVSAARTQFLATSGASPLVYSLSQLNIDAALFAASKVTGANTSASAFAKSLKPRDAGGSSNQQVCVTPSGQFVTIRAGDVQTPGSSCHDPELYVPPHPCSHGQHNSPDDECLPPDPNPKPFTPGDCKATPFHHLSQSGDSCLPDKSPTCPNGISANPFAANTDCTIIVIRSSVDPNAKYGPSGLGLQQFHSSTTAYNYTVEFENQPTASLPAQQVVVTDSLDTSTLDLSTFSLGPILFGNYTLRPAAASQQFSGGIDLRPELNLIVKVDAGLNRSTGVVTWRFTSLDPDTEQPTTNAAAGFLPPDVNPPQGTGYVFYTIHPRTGVASGSVVCNQATVIFDTNAPINTANWCNTIDDIAPSSKVTQLPAYESTASFPVQWTGTDAGAGIDSYTIYVSDNGAPYAPWLTSTTLTGSSYPGTLGHTYAFYSIAQDLAGNVEGVKIAADTLTTVGAPSCATDVSAQFNIVRSGYRLNTATQRFQQVVTITSTAPGPMTGPFAFAVKSLDSDATLYGASGVTSCIAPLTPYIVVNPGAAWNSGQSLTLTLDFVDPKKTGITYTPLILNGASR